MTEWLKPLWDWVVNLISCPTRRGRSLPSQISRWWKGESWMEDTCRHISLALQYDRYKSENISLASRDSLLLRIKEKGFIVPKNKNVGWNYLESIKIAMWRADNIKAAVKQSQDVADRADNGIEDNPNPPPSGGWQAR